MESRVLIKIKAGQTETFSSSQYKELTIGRDPSCDIKFDPNDDLVSRRHAKITKVSDVPEYTIADLGSRNGTLLNKKRIFEPARLNCGDQVQLGPDGPQFEFDLDPRPASMIKPTRLSDAPIGGGTTLPPTRESQTPLAPTRQSPTPSPTGVPAERAPIGKATVERMISQTKTQGRKMMYTVTAGLVVVIGLVAVGLYLKQPPPPPPPPPTNLPPTVIAQRNTEATVFFEVGWKLIDTSTGKQLYHVVTPNKKRVGRSADVTEEIIPNGGEFVQVFLMADGKPEPLLATDDNQGKCPPIGGRHSGTGFVVSNEGYILTNRHVAASWLTSYDFPRKYRSAVVGASDDGKGFKWTEINASAVDWVPANAQFILSSCQDFTTLHRLPTINPRGKVIEGRNDYLDVTFAKNRIRIPAKLARTSDRQDVALVKIDTPQSLKKTELNDNYDSIKVGDPVVTLGYPAVSEAVVGVVMSRDAFNQQMTVKEIPDPTLSVGYVGRVLRGAAGMEQAKVFAGDYYQLTINSTGPGNSGGPVFDGDGHVIAIFTLGIKKQDVLVSGAIPIRYGLELMSVKPMETR